LGNFQALSASHAIPRTHNRAQSNVERDQFDPVVERMEDTFKPSQECAHASMR
jgi:hypothetical protein